MARIPFSQVLKNASVDLRKEYERLYKMFFLQEYKTGSYTTTTLRKYCASTFMTLPIRGTCISLEDFDSYYHFHFASMPTSIDIDYLVSLCEYTYNLAFYNQGHVGSFSLGITLSMQIYIHQVKMVIEKIGYMENSRDGITDFVPKDQAAIAVSEIIDPNLSYKVIEYNHHSMKGDLERKRATLLTLADKLEPQRVKLKNVNPTLEDNLFFLFNNVNLRHNNADPNGKNYKSFIASMKSEEIEKWYDETYQMCLLAFLELDHEDRKARIAQLKQDVHK